jgi:hypothetical protein
MRPWTDTLISAGAAGIALAVPFIARRQKG